MGRLICTKFHFGGCCVYIIEVGVSGGHVHSWVWVGSRYEMMASWNDWQV